VHGVLDSKDIEGVSANTRKLLRGGRVGALDTFQETPDMVAARILRMFGAGKGEVIVLSDEAHHCYQDKLLEHPDDEADSEDQERNREARVWFRGLLDLRRKAGVKTVYDLSATPYYLKGSGYNEGFIFPWVVSDFSLMDAIESGIVKVPRIPVDDDAPVKPVVFRNLWDHIVPPLPKRRSTRPKDVDGLQGWTIPSMLQGAVESIYRSYERNYRDYEQSLAGQGEPPPVMIVVCPNTVVSKLMFDWIAGRGADLPDGSARLVPGNLALFSNVEDGAWTTRQRTILVDSEQLESDKPLTDEFRKYAAREIEAFKQALRLREPGADIEKLKDADLLREAMNTIGKKDKLGEHIRCVVSVAMLTEGWDANTVTHILGVRPFRSQLLCEQVVGRGLRRRSYVASPETGMFEAEYAEVYGVPFAFIPNDRPSPSPKLPRPAIEVKALPERWQLAIRFPKLDGYRVELPDEDLHADFGEWSALHLKPEDLPPIWAQSQWLVGKPEDVELENIRNARDQTVAFHLAKALMAREELAALGGVERPWLFPQLVGICRRWLDECFSAGPGVTKGHLLLAQPGALAAEKVFGSIVHYPRNRAPVLMPGIRRYDSMGSTDEVHFLTRKVVMEPPPNKSHLNHVVLDGLRGNSWEEALAQVLESDPRVLSYVKNERLGFSIPYVHEGRSHEYVPDFLVRLVTEAADVERTLIVEVSGTRKSPGPTEAKASTARSQWCAAVNNWGEFGRWGYVQIGNPSYAQALELLDEAIDNLYADNPIVGLPTEAQEILDATP
jgi:type III restriction enzyme